MDKRLKNSNDLLKLTQLDTDTFFNILNCAEKLKEIPYQNLLHQHSMAMIFEKPSLRTRVSFELAIVELGGYAVVIKPEEIQMGVRESIRDVAMYLSKNVSCAVLRVFKHETLTEFAKYAEIPVVNALCDLEHPCQALADILTIKEQFGELKNVKLTYVGDGNNVCHSLMIAAALSGMKFTICCPKGYEPLVEYVNYTAALNKISNGTLIIENNFEKAIKDSDVLYTDVWASMGQEQEKETRMKVFIPYQLDHRCLSLAPNAKIMHCLPAHRGEEITTEILESENSIIFNQAENRRHAQKAVLLFAYNKL